MIGSLSSCIAYTFVIFETIHIFFGYHFLIQFWIFLYLTWETSSHELTFGTKECSLRKAPPSLTLPHLVFSLIHKTLRFLWVNRNHTDFAINQKLYLYCQKLSLSRWTFVRQLSQKGHSFSSLNSPIVMHTYI